MSPAMLPLGAATLANVSDRGLAAPNYDRSKLVPRIAHIGVGGFHRAHMAMYCNLLAAAGSDWGIRGIGLLLSDEAMDRALRSQDFLYTLTIKADADRSSVVIGSIIDYVLAPVDTAPAVAALADPVTSIISMTVTEAGYSDEPSSRRTFDVIAAGLAERWASGAGPVTVLSCDNLPGNGDAARQYTLAAAARQSSELAEWVAENCSFPNSMVDRITPQTADADREYLAATYGVNDEWPVVAEPFCQWVLEDDFAAGRPAFDEVGALYTTNVHAWEIYKLRMLNAGHSCIAYLSALADIEFVDQALADRSINQYLRQLLELEALPTIEPIPGHSRADYAATVVERFANSGVRDQIARLCVDGTAKFPTFLMPTIDKQLQLDGPVYACALAVAGWARYLAVVDPAAQAPDALGHLTRPLALAAAEGDVSAFLHNNPAVPAAVASHERFVDAFTAAYAMISDSGPKGAIDDYLTMTQ